MSNPDVHCMPHLKTNTCCYVVSDPATKEAILIDTAVDFDIATGNITYTHADSVIAYCKEKGLTVRKVLETHAHADHLSAAQYIKEQYEAKTVEVGIGEDITKVQQTFSKLYNLDEKECATDGSQFELLFKGGDSFKIGQLTANVLATPGHTPACISYVIGDAVFCGDTFFLPDCGTARCDFPGGSVDDLWNSLSSLLALPDKTRMFVGHDYPSGRDFAWETTVAAQKASNKFMKSPVTREEFTKARSARDAVLSAPGLLHPSLQVNIRAGHLPSKEDNGRSYLKLPLSVLSLKSGHD